MYAGNIELLRLLLSKGVDVESQSDAGYTQENHTSSLRITLSSDHSCLLFRKWRNGNGEETTEMEFHLQEETAKRET